MLMQQHTKSWLETWDDGIVLLEGRGPEGLNVSLSQAVMAGQYFMLTALPNMRWCQEDPKWKFFGVSPTGLAHGNLAVDYLGHVFWDMETWMYPAMLPLQRELAEQMLEYRLAMQTAAQSNSRGFGTAGARYPWESARTGVETTPSADCADNEIHISGDISLAVQQLLWSASASDKHLYIKWGPLLQDIARFWASRAVLNASLGRYEIQKVMPPDEYVVMCNNSVYTNSLAKQSLQAPLLLAIRFEARVTQEMRDWLLLASKIFIIPPLPPSQGGWVPEYDGYGTGQKVKQADVVLLQYPLQANLSDDTFARNIAYYSKVTDVHGPAMTWSIFSINLFQLQDISTAVSYFIKNTDYMTLPFYVWSESVGRTGARNFHTGIGGFLQNILYGAIGLRIGGMDQRDWLVAVEGAPVVEPGVLRLVPRCDWLLGGGSITLHRLRFQGAHMRVRCHENNTSISLMLNGSAILVKALDDGTIQVLDWQRPETTVRSQPIDIHVIYST